MEAANARKNDRYSSLADDIKEAGYACKNIPFNIGSRGHITLENKLKLTIVHKLCNPRTNFTKFLAEYKQNKFSIFLVNLSFKIWHGHWFPICCQLESNFIY